MLPSKSSKKKAMGSSSKHNFKGQKGKQQPIKFEAEKEDEDEDEEEEDIDEEGMHDDEEGGSDEDGSMASSMEGIDDAVSQTMMALGELESPEAVEEAFAEIKGQVKVLLYTACVGKLFGKCLEAGSEGPFPERNRPSLVDLFHRCTIHEHNVFKDNEWTLGSRRDACGASTTLIIRGEEEDEGDEGLFLQFILTWYWRSDEEHGFWEEFSLVREIPIDEDDEDSEADRDDQEKDDVNHSANCTSILEGIRTASGISGMEVNLEALDAAEKELRSGLTLQTLLRFLLLCTRCESPKIQGKLSSITDGYNPDEDAEDFCKFLNSFCLAGGDQDVQAQKQKKRSVQERPGKSKAKKPKV
jgi:hypothetical protein